MSLIFLFTLTIYKLRATWNVTLHVAAQDVKLYFEFGPQPIFSLADLPETLVGSIGTIRFSAKNSVFCLHTVFVFYLVLTKTVIVFVL